MAFKQKTWTDRVAEFINRRLLTKEDGSTELVTVARSEGTVSTEGDGFTAKNMNDLEQRIYDALYGLNLYPCTQAEYDSMESHDATTLYIITPEETGSTE